MRTLKIHKVLAILIIFLFSMYADAATTLKEAFTEGTLKGELSTLFFSRDYDGKTQDKEDFAGGTALYFHTAPLHGLSAGLAYVSGNDLGSDDNKAVYGGLLADNNGKHDSFSRLQEYYIQADYFNTNVKLGAHEIFTPFAHIDPIRLQKRTFKGLSVVNKSIPNLTLDLHYLTGYVDYSDSNFKNVAEIREVRDLDDDKRLLILGARYHLPTEAVNSTLQAWYYDLEDVYNQTYLKASVEKKVGDYTFHIMPSALYQKASGDEIAGDVKTEQYGFNTGVRAYGALLRAFFASTGENDLIANYGDEKAFIMQANNSRRADEDAYGIKLDYDFGYVGIKGLTTYATYGIFDTPESGTNASSDATEIDFSIKYKFHGFLEGVTARARYAIVDMKDSDDYNDFRFYLTFKFGGPKPKK
ncbi:outer membrane porin [Denitrovibrio acetiphilus DSM 12809]|uniref:Outer membrane porin n=1 Tax=Denitrovibrio acetiphilus (strain DSM 12809 / NBRC 114555 / N2460) TaxID=522772 RepID=D4H154_DENA2|nr:OprD family outer membrane porin [Denitrovibrio acetiphilus]ADD68717.1 outer membrane porin [Denitrovibrio acetiphilus DSM 12809]